MWGADNPASEWTPLSIPSFDATDGEMTRIHIPAGGTIVWKDKEKLVIECLDIDSGKWLPTGTCSSGAEWDRVKSKDETETTTRYRFIVTPRK
jgi:hypothetical protein